LHPNRGANIRLGSFVNPSQQLIYADG